MEYAIARGAEVKRMTYEQQIALKVMERNTGRGLFPHEIQDRFVLPPLKATWMIPELDNPQASHSQRIKSEFYQQGIYPKFEHLSPLDLDRCHEFDEAINQSAVDFVYSGGVKRKSLRDEVGE